MTPTLATANAQLAEAIERLAVATEHQVRRDRERERQERNADPWFQAQLEAVRRPARRMSPVAFARACPEAFAQFKHVVPGEFYTQVDVELHNVACPCGETHEVPDVGPRGAECGRYFMFWGEELRVAFSPKGTEPLPQEPPDPLVD